MATTQAGPATAGLSAPTIGPKPPLPKAKTIQEGLELTPEEQTVFGAIDDRKAQLEEAGFFMMLRRIAALPKLTADELDMLGRPTTSWLKKHPDFYRGQPIRMTVYVFEVQRYTFGAEGVATPWWPKDAPVWQLSCENANCRRPGDEPLMVFSVTDPMPVLGKPEKEFSDGTKLWPIPKKAEVVGVFYKMYATLDRGDDKTAPTKRDYPVLLVWQFEARSPSGASTWFESQAMIWVGALMVLAFGWIYLRRRASRLRKADGESRFQYRPLRHALGKPSGQEAQKPAEAAEAASAEVDAELRAAAEEYRKRRRGEDAQNDPG